MVVDDLRLLPTSPLVVAEGSPISPAVIPAGIAERSRAVWLMPTAEAKRAGPRSRLYTHLAAEIEREVEELSAPTLAVDGSSGIDEIVTAVEELFANAVAEGPRAVTLAERRVLLREANEAIVAQVRGYYARPWADGDANAVLREFVCECGDTACTASVELRVGVVSAEPALATGHG